MPWLRQALSDAGHHVGRATEDPAFYDKSLAAAVVAFQPDNGVPGDGFVGPRPRELLEALIAWRGYDEPTAKQAQVPTPEPEPEERPVALRATPVPESAVPAWGLAAAALALLFAAWRGGRRTALEITEDSRDFQEALKLWLPWLMAKQGTPRSVKRFVNRLRYLAIRLRNMVGEQKHRFPEPSSVALAAIHYLQPRWLAEAEAFRRVTSGGGLQELIAEDFKAQKSAPALEKTLAPTTEKYAAWTKEQPSQRGTWPPSGERREAFLAVLDEHE